MHTSKNGNNVLTLSAFD